LPAGISTFSPSKKKNRRARPVSPSIKRRQALRSQGASDMSSGQLGDIPRQLRRAALLPDGGEMTDGQLLECFITRRDEVAFEALVRRHGPMVLGVCRRVLRHVQDAEDAFQATFLILVRKADAIGQRELLGNWLYGVAYRTALEARAKTNRRRTRERQVSPMPEPEADDGTDVGRDLRLLLDQELNRLPDKYRVPVVLCDLEGETRRDVAQKLGIPLGTLSGRLTTARRLLAKRLARHGVGVALTAVLSPSAASACVSAPLVASTVEAATAVAAGQMAAGVVSVQVAALTEGVLKAMWVKKLKIVTTWWLTAGIILGGAAVVVQANREAPDAGPAKVLKLDARGRRVVWSPDGKTLVVGTKVEKTFLGVKVDGKGSAIQLWDVDKGQVRQTLAESPLGGLAFQQVVFSADGKMIAATVAEEIRRANSLEIRDVVKVWDARTLALKQTLGGDSQAVCVALSPDGKRVATGDPGRKKVHLWNARTGVLERTLPTGAAQPWSVAFSPDGKTLVVGGQMGDHSGEVTLWDPLTGDLKHALKVATFVNAVAFSPDGKMIASSTGGEFVQVWGVEKGDVIVTLNGHKRGHRSIAFAPDGKLLAVGGPDGKVRLWEMPTGRLREILEGHQAEIYSVAFSPDGKTLASTSQDQTVRLWPIK
jgi:RNA polymerase sigma factor (sigma-70 family)